MIIIKISLLVLDPPKLVLQIPKRNTSGQNDHAFSSSSAFIRCRAVRGSPLPLLRWSVAHPEGMTSIWAGGRVWQWPQSASNNMSSEAQSDHHDVTPGYQGAVTLELRNLTPSDHGSVFTCTAENDAGSSAVNWTLGTNNSCATVRVNLVSLLSTVPRHDRLLKRTE